jgi:hypothetical protein
LPEDDEGLWIPCASKYVTLKSREAIQFAAVAGIDWAPHEYDSTQFAANTKMTFLQ